MGALWTSPGARRLVFGSLLVAALTACPSTPAFDGPPFDVEVGQFAGTVLSGSVPTEAELDQAPWALELKLLRVQSFQVEEGQDSGEALSSRTLYVFAEPSPDPLKTRSELAVGVRVYGTGTPLTEVVSEQRFTEMLWPGSAIRFEAKPNESAPQSTDAPWTSFGWWFSRPPGGEHSLEVAVIFEGWVHPEVDAMDDMEESFGDAPSEAAAIPFLQREQLLFSGKRLLAGDEVRVVFPAPRPGRPFAAEIIEARLVFEPDTSDPIVVEALERGLARLESERVRTATESIPPPEGKSWAVSRDRAVQSLIEDPLQRPALLFLAESGGAAPTSDLVMVASDSWMQIYTSRILATLADPEGATEISEPDALGWHLEHQTYLWLAEIDGDPARELPPELVALLLVHAGELGRYPDLLAETLSTATGRDDAHRRIVAENKIFLEDSDPSSRVRAFDWLSRRGEAPAGYDPLAPIAERRAALVAAEELEQ